MTIQEFMDQNPCIDKVINNGKINREDLIRQGEFLKTHTFIFCLFNDRVVDIIKLRCGIMDGRYWTLQAIADKYGITGERVRQIEKRIFKRLSNPIYINWIINFLDKSADRAKIVEHAGTKRFIKKDIEARGIQAKADKIKLEETQKEQRLKIWREDPSKVLIEHLQLTTITTNLLRKQEIFTLQNILDYYSLHGNFEFIKSLGPVRRQEVYSKMQEIGVDLNKYFVNSQQGRLKNAITHPNNVLIEDLGLSNRAFNLLKRQGVNTLSDLVDLYYKYNGNFTYIMNLGVVYQEEISLKIKELGLNTNQDNLNV